VFLSPPWGGIGYKASNNYSIKEMVYPNINLIVEKCLSFSEKIIFYLPRSIFLEEIFEIIESSIKEKEVESIYLDIHILNSANKIKAIMLVFGLNPQDKVNLA